MDEVGLEPKGTETSRLERLPPLEKVRKFRVLVPRMDFKLKLRERQRLALLRERRYELTKDVELSLLNIDLQDVDMIVAYC